MSTPARLMSKAAGETCREAPFRVRFCGRSAGAAEDILRPVFSFLRIPKDSFGRIINYLNSTSVTNFHREGKEKKKW